MNFNCVWNVLFLFCYEDKREGDLLMIGNLFREGYIVRIWFWNLNNILSF